MPSISSQDIGHFPHHNTNSPGQGVGSGQAEPAVGVGSQPLPIPAGEYEEFSRELDGGTRDTKN